MTLFCSSKLGMWKNFFELHRQIGHTPSKGLASPGLNKGTSLPYMEIIVQAINLMNKEDTMHYQQILEQSL